jgi:hypothetical protein
MTGTSISQQEYQEHEEFSPALRLVYAVGVILTAFGSNLPGGHRWNIIGVALITFCYVY